MNLPTYSPTVTCPACGHNDLNLQHKAEYFPYGSFETAGIKPVSTNTIEATCNRCGHISVWRPLNWTEEHEEDYQRVCDEVDKNRDQRYGKGT